MMIVRPILFERWSGLPWNQRTRISESLKSIAARLGKTQMKRYCLGVVVDIEATLESVDDPPIDRDIALDMLGNVNLSHLGGHLVENLPIRLVTISNDIEGYLNFGKRNALITGDVTGPSYDFKHSFVLAYADRFFATGDVDAIDRCQGAKALSLMSGDSQFQLQFNNLPGTWTCPDGVNVSVMLWILETETELVDRPTQILQITDLRDPIELPQGFKKPAFVAVCSQPGQTIGFAGSLGVFPRLEVDAINQLEQLNMAELELMRAWIRPDGAKLGAYGASTNSLLGETTALLLDPFEAQKMTLYNSGHDWNIWGRLQQAQQESGNGILTALMRLYEDLSAADFSVQMSRDNIGMKEREDVYVGGKPYQEHHMTAGELLGVQGTIRTRAAQRKKPKTV